MKERIPKISKMVVHAIKSLSESKGSTPKEIMNFITADLKSPDSTLQRQMTTALQRGVECGVLVRKRGHYSLNDRDRPLVLEEPQSVVDACISPRRRMPRSTSRSRSKCAPKARSKSRKRSRSARSKSCAPRRKSTTRRRSASKKRVTMCKPKSKRSAVRRRRSRSRSRVPKISKCQPSNPSQDIDILDRNVVEDVSQMEMNQPEMRAKSRSHRSNSRARSTHSNRSRNHG